MMQKQNDMEMANVFIFKILSEMENNRTNKKNLGLI